METYIDRIKKLKSQRKMTNELLSSRSGIPLGTLSKILAGMSDSPKLSNIVAICNALGCSVEYVVSGAPENTNNYTLSGEEIRMIEDFRRLDPISRSVVETVIEKELERGEATAETSADQNVEKPTARVLRTLPTMPATGRYVGERVGTTKKPLPLYNLPVSAGVGLYLDEALAESINVPNNEKTEYADYALRISGNSMEPKYHDGDILLVQQTESVEVGELGIFLLDGCGFFKVYGGDRLITLNEEYGPILLKDYADVRCAGLVIGRLKRK